MKKIDVMRAISDVKYRAEAANSCLRQTARRWDPELPGLRPTTKLERKSLIIDAWYHVHKARKEAKEAEQIILDYATQNGISIAEIDLATARRV
jgi:hypothetical protein